VNKETGKGNHNRLFFFTPQQQMQTSATKPELEPVFPSPVFSSEVTISLDRVTAEVTCRKLLFGQEPRTFRTHNGYDNER